MPDEHPREALVGLLAEAYSRHGLRWLVESHLRDNTWTRLPEGSASRDQVADALVDVLTRRHVIDGRLFARIVRDHPDLKDRIEQIRRALNVEASVLDDEHDPPPGLRRDLRAAIAPIEFGLASRALQRLASQPPENVSSTHAHHLARLLDAPRSRRWRIWCDLLAALNVPASPELVSKLDATDGPHTKLPDVIDALHGLVVLATNHTAPPPGLSAVDRHTRGVFVGATATGPVYVAETGAEWIGEPAPLLAALRTLFPPAPPIPGDDRDFRGQVAAILLQGGELLPGGWIRDASSKGSGSSAILYRGRHIELDKPVAIKVARDALDAAARQRFRREADLLARLDEPCFVGVLAYGETPRGQPFLVEEWIAGEGFDRRKPIHGDVRSAEQYLDLFRQWARALTLAHSRGIVHRDIAPYNLMIRDSGSAVVIDFGLAHEYESGRTSRTDVDPTGRFHPPADRQGNPAGDAYALAASVLERATGQEFHASDLGQQTDVLERHLKEVSVGRAGRELAAWIEACLRATPDRGPRLLAAADAGELPPGLGRLERIFRWAQRHPVRVFLALLAMGALIGGYLWIDGEREQAQRDLATARRFDTEVGQRYRDNLEAAGDRHLEDRSHGLAALAFAEALIHDDNPRLRGKLLRAAAEPAPELLWQVSESGPRYGNLSFLTANGALAGALTQNEVHLWDTRSGKAHAWPFGTSVSIDPREPIIISPTENRLAVRGRDGISILDLDGAAVDHHPLRDMLDSGLPIAWTGNGARLLALACSALNADDTCTRVHLRSIDPDRWTNAKPIHLSNPELFDERGAPSVHAILPNSDGSRVALSISKGRVLIVDDIGSRVALTANAGGSPATLALVDDDTYMVGFDGERGLLRLDARTGAETQISLSPLLRSRIHSFTAIRALPDGDLVVAGCARGTRSCARGFLARLTADGQERWFRALPTNSTLSVDGEQLVVLGEESLSILRIDADRGDPLELAVTTGHFERRTILAESSALVTWEPAIHRGAVRVHARDPDDGSTVAYADRKITDLVWAELLPDGEVLAIDHAGQVLSLGEYALESPRQIAAGVPVARRHPPTFAASRSFIASFVDATLHLVARNGQNRRQFQVPTTTVGIMLLDGPPRLFTSDSSGFVNELDITTGIVRNQWPVPFKNQSYFELELRDTPYSDWLSLTNARAGVTLLDRNLGGRTSRQFEPSTTGLHVSSSPDARWVWSAKFGRTESLELYPDNPEADAPLMTLRLPRTGAPAEVVADEHQLRVFTGLGFVQAWRLDPPSLIPSYHVMTYDSEFRTMLRWYGDPKRRARFDIITFGHSGENTLASLPDDFPPARYVIAPGGRYIMNAIRTGSGRMYSGLEIRDMRSGSTTHLRLPKKNEWQCRFDSAGAWVACAQARKIQTHAIGAEKDPSFRPSHVKFTNRIRDLWGASPGRFLVQEGPRSLSIYDARTDTLGRRKEYLSGIREVLCMGEDLFIIAFDNGDVSKMVADSSGTLTGSSILWDDFRGSIEGLLRGPQVLVTAAERDENGKRWDLWSVRSEKHLATLGPWLGADLEIRGDEIWVVEHLEGQDHLSRELRVPLELLEANPNEIVGALADLQGSAEFTGPHPRDMTIEPTPPLFVID